jgi:hypothetical protein
MKLLMLTLVATLLIAGACFADVPLVLNHQGMLTDAAGAPLTGDFFITFRMYEVETGGAEIWSEVQQVTVDHGVFNVYLGVAAPLDDALFGGQDIYLGVKVEDDDEMTPRLRLGSVIYAFTANRAADAPPTWYLDGDDDGYGDPAHVLIQFSQPPGYVSLAGDCNDGDPDINPGVVEIDCDGIDHDCDGFDANGIVGPSCVMQAGVCNGSTRSCESGAWAPCGPTEYGPYYEQVEYTCDGLDNDCDGSYDEGAICDDGNACTTDYCDPVLGCIHEPIICDDGNPCTDDDCDPVVGCVFANNISACDDGDDCTVDDQCIDGMCVGTPIDCDDGLPCTIDACDGFGGCDHSLIAGYCLIDGVCYSDGEHNPLEECLVCDAANPSVWSELPNGMPCAGGICNEGTCVPLGGR